MTFVSVDRSRLAVFWKLLTRLLSFKCNGVTIHIKFRWPVKMQCFKQNGKQSKHYAMPLNLTVLQILSDFTPVVA